MTVTPRAWQIRRTSRAPLERGAVHLWGGRLDELTPDETILSQDERDRAHRFRFALHKSRYVTGRTWLRRVLACYADDAPERLSFRYLDRGKPVLADPEQTLEFSMAHSGPLALIAVAVRGPLGVDVEQAREGVFDRQAAALVLSPQELALIERSAHPDGTFLRCWVRKEAFAKASGAGLDRSLARITLTTSDGGFVDHEAVQVSDVRCGTGVVAAVASPTDQAVTYCGQWTEKMAWSTP